MPALADLLAQKGVLLADGATGTNLFEMGLMSGDPPEMWNLDHPERIRALHQSFVDAGADIILTNSFGGNRRRLALHKLDGRVARAQCDRGRQTGRAVADAAGPSGRRRRLGRSDRRSLRAARPPDRGRGDRGLRRADRGPEGGRRRRRLDRDHVGPGGDARRGEGGRPARHALYGHGELRHCRQDHDGRAARLHDRRRRRSRPAARSPSAPIAASAPRTFSSRSCR